MKPHSDIQGTSWGKNSGHAEPTSQENRRAPVFHSLALIGNIFAIYWVYFIVSGATFDNGNPGDMMGGLRPFVYGLGCFFISCIFAVIGFLRSERLNIITKISSSFSIIGFILGLMTFAG